MVITSRSSLVSEKMDFFKIIFFHIAESISFVPSFRKNVYADLTTYTPNI